MKRLAQLLLIPALCLAAASAGAAVTVRFNDPNHYTDIGINTDRDDILRELSDHFVKLGKRLPPGQDLTIEVLNLDLAGRVVPQAGRIEDLRILNGGADWPSMQLRYTLSANGQVLRSAEANLSHQLYLRRIAGYASGTPLPYEKQMIDEWFAKEFGVSRRPTR